MEQTKDLAAAPGSVSDSTKDRTMRRRARLIAIYLPQFHPIPENDRWWGKGFTEWTNVTRARPLFKGHYQPRLPADLGFYDLRVPEIREAQAELARDAGIEAFCYYHYWFGGKRLLERPFCEVVASGHPNFPFCVCWANESWSGIWHGAPERLLIEQTYPGPEDNRQHFLAMRDAFLDARYVKVNGRPVFAIYRPTRHPSIAAFVQQWQGLASQNGLPGLHFVAHLTTRESDWDYKAAGFDGSIVVSTKSVFSSSMRNLFDRLPSNGSGNGAHPHAHNGDRHLSEELRHWLWRRGRAARGEFANVRLYRHALPYLLEGCSSESSVYPCVTPNWDNSARVGDRAYVLHESTPELFRGHLREALSLVESRPEQDRMIFIKSWNEWAEGNYIEPDQRFGMDYLRVIREEVMTA